MCSVSNYVGKGNISEEIVEVSLPFVFKLIGIIPTLSLYYGLYQYALKKKTMMELSHHCLFYFASYINHSGKC